MKKETMYKLRDAEEYAERTGMSTEMMIQYMQDSTGLSFECVMNYINITWERSSNND